VSKYVNGVCGWANSTLMDVVIQNRYEREPHFMVYQSQNYEHIMKEVFGMLRVWTV